MASTYSPNLGLELMATGEDSGTWGTKTNTNLSPLLETSIVGVSSVVYASDADKTLTITNGTDSAGRYFTLVCTGTISATRKLICPLVNKTYLVVNTTTGGQSLNVIGASGTGTIVPNGTSAFIYCDGTNYNQAITGFNNLKLVTPVLGAATGTSLSLGGATLGSNALAVTGHILLEGVTSTGATGTGNLVFGTSPTLGAPTLTGHPTIEGVTSTGATGTGNLVFGTSPTIAAPTITGNITGNGIFSGGVSVVGVSGGTISSGPNGVGGISFYSQAQGQPADHSWENFVAQISGYPYICYGNGDCYNTNGVFAAFSDIKLKQDIAPAASQWNDIKAIGKIVSKYHLKKDPNGPLHIGVVAQDLQAISPGLVSVDNDFEIVDGVKTVTGTQTLGVKYSILYMKAIKALGEALERIETLEARLTELEAKP